MSKLAVIGYPIAHSRSPAMQNAGLEALGLSDGWSYGAIEAAPGDFERVVRELAASGEYAGANVTVPHKEAAVALADAPSEAARAIGAANTLVFGAAGIEAYNTDAAGLLASLSGSPPSHRALVLGAGGAARAAIWGLAHADEVAGLAVGFEVDVWNRTGARAEAVYAELGGHRELRGAVVQAPAQDAYGVIVNATAVGMHGEDPFAELPLDPAGFAPGQLVVDLVYGEGPSLLLAAAEHAGATVVDGLEVLVQQGALSLRIWTGLEPPLEVMRAAVRG